MSAIQVHRTLLIVAVFLGLSAQAETRHVPSEYPTIQEAMDVALNGDVVLVDDGTYVGFGNRDLNFDRRSFTVRSVNGPRKTIIDCQGSQDDPHRGFMLEDSPDNRAAEIEGFTITNGWVTDFFGGGAISVGGYDLVLTNCIIHGNVSTSDGSGLSIGGNCCDEGSAAITNCKFIGNIADQHGGAIFIRQAIQDDPVEINNCTFVNNIADFRGGAVYASFRAEVFITNCIAWNDSAGKGHELAFSGSNVDAWIRYSDLSGGRDGIYLANDADLNWGNGNIESDPLFAAPDDDDHRLTIESPCVNSGKPNYVPGPNERDLDGHARILCDRVDMGAYEFGIGDYDCDGGVDLIDWGFLQSCFTGNGAPYDVGCESLDFNADFFVDLWDFESFQTVFTGPQP